MIPETDYPPALRLKCSAPCAICLTVVLRTIQFDNQLSFNAAKVGNVGRNRMLAAELQSAQLLSTQDTQQPAFCICHFLAQTT